MLIDCLQHYLYIVMFFTGLLAATIDAIAGGGGLISLPVLLGVGVPPHVALGTNKLQSLFGTASATHRYYKQGLLNKSGLLTGIVCTFLGSLSGACLTQVMSGEVLKQLIPILLFIVLLYSILSPRIGALDASPRIKSSTFYFIFGTLLGFYDGFLGPGVGAFWVFLLVYFLGFDLMKATAHTKLFNLNTNFAAMMCFAISQNIDYKIGLCMAAGQMVGGRLGANLAIKKGAGLIRPIFILVVTSTITTLIYRNYATQLQDHVMMVFVSLMLIISGILWVIFKRKKRLLPEQRP